MYNKKEWKFKNTPTARSRIALPQWWSCEYKGQLGEAFGSEISSSKIQFLFDFHVGDQKLDIISEKNDSIIKVINVVI